MAYAVDNMNFESQMEYVNHEDNCGQMTHTDNVDDVCQIEDFENIDDVHELKRMATYLIYANKIICRRRINALKSLENYMNYMKYLKKTRATMIYQHDMKVLHYFHFLSKGMLHSIKGLKRLQKVICMLHESNYFKGEDKEDVLYLHDAFSTVPDDNFKNSSDKLLKIVEKLENIKDGVVDIKDYDKNDLGGVVVPATTVQASTNFDERRKLESSDMSTHDEHRKETPENATKSEKLRRKRGQNKRAKKPSESCMKTDSKSTDRSKDTCSDQISPSVDDSFHLKDLVIKVTDFMLDDFADRDPYIAKFKALCESLVSDDESKAADSDADHDFDENDPILPPAENDEEDDLEKASFTTVESADDTAEEESTASKSTANLYTTVESADDDFEIDSAASPSTAAVCTENAEGTPASRSPPFSPTHVSGRTRGRGPRTPPEPEPLEI